MSLIITLDGPGGSGKSTVARLCAESVGGLWLNSGEAYRLLTWSALQKGWNGTSDSLFLFLPDLIKAGAIRWELVDHQVICYSVFAPPSASDQVCIEAAIGAVATQPCVRQYINFLLRNLCFETLYFFFEGRDMGSVVFPEADIKIFLTASPEARARRRFIQRPSGQSLQEIQDRLFKRDAEDANRPIGALIEPEGCWLCDSSNLSFEETIKKILDHLQEKLGSIFLQVDDAVL